MSDRVLVIGGGIAGIRSALDLAEALGTFAVQLADGHPAELNVLARGELAKWDTEPVTLAAIKGLLAPSVERVTLVNAALLAKEGFTGPAGVLDAAGALPATFLGVTETL